VQHVVWGGLLHVSFVYVGHRWCRGVPCSTSLQATSLADSWKYPLARLTSWQRTAAKAKVLFALAHVQNILASATSRYASLNGSTCPLALQLKPSRRVTVTTNIYTGKPGDLLVVPMTSNVVTVKETAPVFLKTSVEVPGTDEVVSLGQTYQDPATATEQKPAAVEYFWAIRRSEKVDECNMIITEVKVVFGTGVCLPGQNMLSGNHQVMLPVMVTTKDIDAHQELVCYYKESGEKALKRARLT
jgi:hypothetical protein